MIIHSRNFCFVQNLITFHIDCSADKNEVIREKMLNTNVLDTNMWVQTSLFGWKHYRLFIKKTCK